MISQHPYYLSGRVKFEAGDFDGAVNDYSVAIVAEENPFLYSERAVAWFHLGHKEKSLDDLNYAAELEPENPYRYASRAYVKDAMGDTEGAIADYERAIELDPDDAIAHNNLGLLQEKLGYNDRAKINFNRADRLAEESWPNAYPQPPSPEPSEALPDEHSPVPPSFWRLIYGVFTTREGFLAYLRFIRNGFKS